MNPYAAPILLVLGGEGSWKSQGPFRKFSLIETRERGMYVVNSEE